MSENIKALVTLNANGYEPEGLDAMLKVLAKNGLHPKYYEPEDIEQIKAEAAAVTDAFRSEFEGTLPKPEVLGEWRTTEYDSISDVTTVSIRQNIKGSI